MSLKQIHDQLIAYGLTNYQANKIVEMVRNFGLAAIERYLRLQ